ncbi:hypothetical protein C942_04118 [Photobacterium marinum]|uniref:Uncharacterized protein n=1 Tax=Photobacterium marinum TaxID=1056511 RepID=L8J653_9GAMM|nr:hypothetical protein C942_04118 [Photobacterium marinum]
MVENSSLISTVSPAISSVIGCLKAQRTVGYLFLCCLY